MVEQPIAQLVEQPIAQLVAEPVSEQQGGLAVKSSVLRPWEHEQVPLAWPEARLSAAMASAVVLAEAHGERERSAPVVRSQREPVWSSGQSERHAAGGWAWLSSADSRRAPRAPRARSISVHFHAASRQALARVALRERRALADQFVTRSSATPAGPDLPARLVMAAPVEIFQAVELRPSAALPRLGRPLSASPEKVSLERTELSMVKLMVR